MYDEYWESQLRCGRAKSRLEEEGTREQHLLDLLDDWKTALTNAESRDLHTEAVEQVMKELRLGIALLQKQLATYSGYDYESGKFYDRVITEQCQRP